MSAPRPCAWCTGPIPSDARSDARTCSKKCRQTAFRLRRRGQPAAAGQDGPLTFAYADPPYPGRARRYYQSAEVDHRELIVRLEALAPAGWALSTSEDALRWLLPLCPAGAHVCPWVKPHAANPRTHGLHTCWEPLIVVRGRQRPPGVRDWLRAQAARGGGELPGRKPLAFCAWLFDCLGMVPGDSLIDLYPGTGIITRTWSHLSSGAPGDASPEALRQLSPSCSERRLSCRAAAGDASAPAVDDSCRPEQLCDSCRAPGLGDSCRSGPSDGRP